ncbi:unnamed protein product, partial [Nesidiocoris tenuis]
EEPQPQSRVPEEARRGEVRRGAEESGRRRPWSGFPPRHRRDGGTSRSRRPLRPAATPAAAAGPLRPSVAHEQRRWDALPASSVIAFNYQYRLLSP